MNILGISSIPGINTINNFFFGLTNKKWQIFSVLVQHMLVAHRSNDTMLTVVLHKDFYHYSLTEYHKLLKNILND
jgi:hypothetical protein